MDCGKRLAISKPSGLVQRNSLRQWDGYGIVGDNAKSESTPISANTVIGLPGCGNPAVLKRGVLTEKPVKFRHFERPVYDRKYTKITPYVLSEDYREEIRTCDDKGTMDYRHRSKNIPYDNMGLIGEHSEHRKRFGMSYYEAGVTRYAKGC